MLSASIQGLKSPYHLSESITTKSELINFFRELVHGVLGRTYDSQDIRILGNPQLTKGDEMILDVTHDDPVLKDTQGQVLATIFLPRDGI